MITNNKWIILLAIALFTSCTASPSNEKENDSIENYNDIEENDTYLKDDTETTEYDEIDLENDSNNFFEDEDHEENDVEPEFTLD